MDSFSTAFAREVAVRIGEAIEREREALELGLAVADHAAYRERVGKLFAYRQVLTDFMPGAEHDIQNPKTGA